jgi:rhodanese-related sulfurtransferase
MKHCKPRMKNIFRIPLLLTLSVITIFTACGQQKSETAKDNKFLLLSPSEFKTALEKEKDVQLIDVRTPGEVKKGHLSGAKNLNLFDDDFKQQLEKLDKEKPVFVYCHSGGRSAECAGMLKEMGFKYVVDMDGGFSKWQKAGLPSEM